MGRRGGLGDLEDQGLEVDPSLEAAATLEGRLEGRDALVEEGGHQAVADLLDDLQDDLLDDLQDDHLGDLHQAGAVPAAPKGSRPFCAGFD
jgi:hypothetical protein